VHKSRLAGFVINCQTDDLEQAGQFWSRAGAKRRYSVGLRVCAKTVSPARSA